MSEVQGITNPMVEARFIRKSEAKKLDNIRNDYVSLMEEAAELEMKGKTEKAEAKRQAANGAAVVYAETCEKYGVKNNLQEIVTEYAAKPLVADGVKLTKAQRKEVEKLEKELNDARKGLAKYTESEILGYTSVKEKDRAKINELLQKEATAKANYDAKCKEYGVPSTTEILEQLYSIEDPIKASKLIDKIKDELKDANMYFGVRKDYLKSDSFEDVAKAIAIENRVNANLEKGYVGVKKSTAKAFTGRDAAQVADVAFDASGADCEFDRKSNERAINKYALNVEHFAEKDIETNKTQKFSEIPVIYVGGQEIFTQDIERITLLSGAVLTGASINDVQLKDVRTVEVAGKQYDFRPVEKRKGDDGYVSTRKIKNANKSLGFEYTKPNYLKAAGETAAMTLVPGVAALLDTFKVEFHDSFDFSLVLNGGSDGVASSYFEELFEKINNQLKDQLGDENFKIDKIDNVVALEYIDKYDLESEHICVTPVLATAVTAFVANIIEQLQKGEEVVPEKAYHAARRTLTLENKHNAAGGDGHTLGEDELNKVMADMLVVVTKMMKTPSTPAKESVPPTPETPATKTAEIVTTDKEPEIQKAEYCIYENKAGEYWDGIVRNTYTDENGNLISDDADITELRCLIKYKVNKYNPKDNGMPKGVKMVLKYTCKSGKTYTYTCGEPKNRAISTALPQGKTAADVSFGTPRVDLKAGTEDKVLKEGEYTYSWSSSADTTFFGSNIFTNRNDRDNAMKAEKEKLEDLEYTVTVNGK